LEASETAEPPAVQFVEGALLALAGRSLVTAAEVVDLLLDLRSALVIDATLRKICIDTPGLSVSHQDAVTASRS
jgi:hypothetical protein